MPEEDDTQETETPAPKKSNRGRPISRYRIDPAIFEGKKDILPMDELKWIKKHFGMDVSEEESPSSFAYVTVHDCNSDADYRKEITRLILSKSMPNKQQIESQDDESQRETGLNKVIQDIRDAAEKAKQKAAKN